VASRAPPDPLQLVVSRAAALLLLPSLKLAVHRAELPRIEEIAMAERNLVVARYTNGCTIKGYTEDFFPNRPVFHVHLRPGESVAVKMADLKAVFFVKDLLGDRTHRKTRDFGPAGHDGAHGKKIAVLFKDGEVLTGHTLSYVPGKQGFFLFPTDKKGNNKRVYVISAATRDVKVGPAAEQLARTAPVKPRPKAA
jgi:hypothetical protein